MTKKVAVLVRDRQGEALRMAVGIILLDDMIDVYVLDRKVAEEGSNELYLETIVDMEMNAFSNCKGIPKAIEARIVNLCAASIPSTSNSGSASA